MFASCKVYGSRKKEKRERFIPIPITEEENAESAGQPKAVKRLNKIASDVLSGSSDPEGGSAGLLAQTDERHSTRGSSEHEYSSEEEALSPEELKEYIRYLNWRAISQKKLPGIEAVMGGTNELPNNETAKERWERWQFPNYEDESASEKPF
ncbi:MAG TPA: hypothetical protein VGL94_20865 [Ktedonobacteraceae bacterium]